MRNPDWYIVCLAPRSTDKARLYYVQRATSTKLSLTSLIEKSEENIKNDIRNNYAIYSTVSVLPKEFDWAFSPIANVRLEMNNRTGMQYLTTSADSSKRDNLSEMMTYEALLKDIEA